MEQLTGRLNEDLKGAMDMNRIYRLQEKLDCEFELIAPARFLVCEERKLRSVSASGVVDFCDVFLFNDLIILVGKQSRTVIEDLASTMAPKLKLQNFCELTQAVVEFSSTNNFDLTISRDTTNQRITLRFKTKERRDEWMARVQEQIHTTSKKAAAFSKEASRSGNSSNRGSQRQTI